MKRLPIGLALISLLLAQTAYAATYEITIRNNTSQTLTSAVCAVHSRRASIFTRGEAASDGLVVLAEDGVASTLRSELRQQTGVRTTAVGEFISGKSSSTLQITAPPGRRLSCVLGMLVATNDAFPAFQGVRLPRNTKRRRRVRATVYDAGSEVNTESCDHVPGGPCDAHFIGEDENGTVQVHEGIQGIADLDPDQHGWGRRAAVVTIRRTK